MGQINSNHDLEGGSDHLGSNNPGPKGNDDPKGFDKSAEKSFAGTKENVDSIHCVKTRIDMLIEDCLNVKDSSDDSNDKCLRREDNGGNDKDDEENSHEDKTTMAKTTREDGERSVNGAIVSGSTGAGSVLGKYDIKGIKMEENSKAVSEEQNAETKEESVANDGKTGDNKLLKISDLITEMTSAEIAQRHNRTVTTFQTFIDKVLDNSLKQVPDVENMPTNILKLCNESMQPPQDAANVTKEKQSGSESTGQTTINKSCTKIKLERKITLKDHIERFLERSFNDDTIISDKSQVRHTKEGDEKKEMNGSKNGFPDNFNAQGLVNNMITQGLEINKLLAPSLLVNHSKDPQKSPDIRLRTPQDPVVHNPAETQKPELKMESALPNALCKSEMVSNRNYGYQNMVQRPGSQMSNSPQLSPSQMAALSHDANKQIMKEMRENQYAQMNDTRGYDGNRRDYPYNRNYSSEYTPEHLHTPHHPGMGQGFHQRVEHGNSMPTMDQTTQSAMYNMYNSPRISSAQYHHQMTMPQSGTVDEQRSQIGRPIRHPIHQKDCICPMCVPHPRQPHDIRDQKKLEYQHQRRSPNIQPYMVSHEAPLQMRGSHMDSTPAMMRSSHSKIPPGAAGYQNMPKLLPHHPPITSTKEYGGQLLVPGMALPQGRRPSLPENSVQRPFIHPGRGGEYGNVDQTEDYSGRQEGHGNLQRVGTHSPYPIRPSSMPSHENLSQDGGSLLRRSPATSDSGSRSSDTSMEAPLDLTVKRSKNDMERPRSSSYSSGAQHHLSQKKLNPSNTFLRHLENSVDKYCQEITSPVESQGTMKHLRHQLNRSITPNDSKQSAGYAVQNPRLPSPHNSIHLQQHRKLPSPQFTGGITMGQPLVESRSQGMQRSGDYQYANAVASSMLQSASMPQQNANQVAISTAQSNFDMNNKRNINTISKHEPIQNIIGSHDPNDILYLICTLCAQTYGSPYGFRKHFRNQHGFEPRSEHTIVQTISATKSALHPPVQLAAAAYPDFPAVHQTISPTVKVEMKESGVLGSSMNTDMNRKSSPEPPLSRRCPSECGSEQSDKSNEMKEKIAQDEIGERKCLECLKCGKTFQLNDFGSYKRHCKQHNSTKVMGPFTCSDCHISFPDQKALKEHYLTHINESQTNSLDSIKCSEETSASKKLTSGTCYVCVKCDLQFENITSYKSHIVAHEQPPKLSPQIDLHKSVETAGASSPQSHIPLKSSLNVIPTQCIVKQAAESMTAQACPDSSWDDSVKPSHAVLEEKQDENTVEISDSGYSSSVGSNSTLNCDNDKFSESVTKSPDVGNITRQKSVDSNSETGEDQTGEDFFYKHKKFSHHRKRGNNSTDSNEMTPPKQAKTVDMCKEKEKGPPVSSSTTLSVGLPCDSSESDDTKLADKVKPEKYEHVEVSTTKEAISEEKVGKDVNLPKAEARHNLPFVWDRTTRSQRKTK